MNNQTQTTVSQRGSFARFFRWLFSGRIVRRMLIVFAWAVTIIALFYGVENWRGRSAWTKYRKQLEARGEVLDLKAFIPKPILDEQNFAATPLIKSWFPNGGVDRATNFNRAAAMVSNPENEKSGRRFEDLVAWEMAYNEIKSGNKSETKKDFSSGKLDSASRAQAAPAVLKELKEIEPQLTELRAASARPRALYPLYYDLENPWGIMLPHLGKIRGVCQQLKLKACAELAAGHNGSALEDVKLMLYLADSVREEPILISYLVRVACLKMTTQPVWEGLAEHRWSDTQLQELQTQFSKYNLLADLDLPLDGERAFGIVTPELIKKKGLGLLLNLMEQGSPEPSNQRIANFIGCVVPSGWFYQEQLNYSRLYDEQMAGAFDAEKKRVFPSEIQAHDRKLQQLIGGGRLGRGLNCIIHHRVIASLMLPSVGKIPLKGASGQTAMDEAALACALERYRLANNQFPDNLSDLLPQFISQLPNDVFSGEPYKYRRTADGKFILYSIGHNEKDDGGVFGIAMFEDKEGDWVWQYTATATAQ